MQPPHRLLEAGRCLAPHRTTLPGPGVSGDPRSEIKEEPKAGDIRGGGHPAITAPRATDAQTSPITRTSQTDQRYQ